MRSRGGDGVHGVRSASGIYRMVREKYHGNDIDEFHFSVPLPCTVDHVDAPKYCAKYQSRCGWNRPMTFDVNQSACLDVMKISSCLFANSMVIVLGNAEC
jgi:hypothetical protein